MRAHALFASLQVDWATTLDRLLGPATCLSHEDGGIPLSVFRKNTTSKLAACPSHYSFCDELEAGKLRIPFLKSFGMACLGEMSPRSINCEEEALTTTPSHRFRQTPTPESIQFSTACLSSIVVNRVKTIVSFDTLPALDDPFKKAEFGINGIFGALL